MLISLYQVSIYYKLLGSDMHRQYKLYDKDSSIRKLIILNCHFSLGSLFNIKDIKLKHWI